MTPRNQQPTPHSVPRPKRCPDQKEGLDLGHKPSHEEGEAAWSAVIGQRFTAHLILTHRCVPGKDFFKEHSVPGAARRECLSVGAGISESAWPKIGMTPQRCLWSPITNRATTSTQANPRRNERAPFVTLGPMSATALSTRYPRVIIPKGRKL